MLVRDCNGKLLRCGNHRGIVTNVDDPLKMGRIKCVVPELYGDFAETLWIFPKCKSSDFNVPKLNSNVWIEFENGNEDIPIYGGTFNSAIGTPHQIHLLAQGFPDYTVKGTTRGSTVVYDINGNTICFSFLYS